MLLEECSPSLVTAEAHTFDLGLFEGIHCDGADEGDVDAQAPMDAGAGEAYEDAEFGRRPLWIRCVAVAANVIIVRFLNGQQLQRDP